MVSKLRYQELYPVLLRWNAFTHMLLSKAVRQNQTEPHKIRQNGRFGANHSSTTPFKKGWAAKLSRRHIEKREDPGNEFGKDGG